MSGYENSLAIKARVSYLDDRRYVVTVDGSDGPLASEPLATMAEVGAVSRGLAARAHPGISDFYVDIQAPRPPWLHQGQVVRIKTFEDVESELGWIGTFIDNGAYINGIDTGGSIVPYEYLDDRPQVTPGEQARIDASKQSAGGLGESPPLA